MADNITAPASGAVLATKDIDGVQHPKTIIVDDAGAPIDFYPATQPVSGAVSVSGTVPVSGTFWQATQPVSIAATVAVSGPLTDAQLRAAAVPVSLASAPLASGAATAANQTSEIAALATIGTRAYAAGQQINVTSTSGATTGLTATEVLLHSSTRCFVRVATASTAAAGIPLEAGEKFHLRLTSGQQIHVIRDTVDGLLNVVPVA